MLRVFDWGDDTDGPYLVLEYLGGGSLRDLLDRDIRLSLSQAAQLGTEVAQGLAYAHLRGLVHRDIKPANLLFDEEGRVRVADFGVARALAEAAWTEPAGAMIGTARYISPEAAEGKPVDGRADVYSLALVLYEAVTGVVPFVKDTTMGTLAARIGQPLPHNDLLGPLDDVLARAAAPDVASRLGRRRAGGPVGRAGGRAADALGPAADHAEARGLRPDRRVPCAGGLGADRLGRGGGRGAPAAALPPAAALGDGTAIAPGLAAASTPIGTKAGPGELFDAEPGAARTPRRAVEAQAQRAAILSTGGPSEPYKPKTSKKWWWIGGGGRCWRSFWPPGCSSPSGPTCSRRRIRCRRWSICRWRRPRRPWTRSI